MNGPRLSILPGDAAFDPAVTGPMYRLLGVLAARADKHGRCWPSISKIAEDMNTSERWVHKVLGRLLETRYLSATHRPGHSSVYQVKGVNSGFTPEPEVHPCPPGSPKVRRRAWPSRTL